MNKPITHEEMKAYVDATWEKCQTEAWKEPHEWVGLTVDEIEAIAKPYEEKNRSIKAWGLFAQAIESAAKEKNT